MPREKTTTTRAAELIVGKLVSTAGLSGVAIVTARQLGPDGRGVIVIIVTVGALSALVGTLGTNVSGRLLLVSSTDPVDLRAYLGIACALVPATAGASALVTFSAAHLADVEVGTAGVIAGGAYGGATVASYLAIDALFAFGYTRSVAIADGTNSTAQLVATALLAATGVGSPTAYVAAMSIGPTVQGALSTLQLARAGHGVRPRLAADQWKRLLRRGLGAVPLLLSQSALYRLDRYIVGVLMTPAAVGLYSVGATGAELLRFVPTAISQVVLYEVASGHQDPGRLRRTRLQVAILTTAIAVVGIAFAPTAVDVVFGDEFAASVGPLRILLLGEVAIALYYVDSAALTGVGRVAVAGAVTVAGLVVVTVGDFALIPPLGVSGAAWASLGGYAIMTATSHVAYRRAMRRTA